MSNVEGQNARRSPVKLRERVDKYWSISPELAQVTAMSNALLNVVFVPKQGLLVHVDTCL